MKTNKEDVREVSGDDQEHDSGQDGPQHDDPPEARQEVIPLRDIDADTSWGRRLDDKHVQSLAASIKAQGLLNPVTVRPAGSRYQLLAGKHRLKAVESLGWNAIPALVRDVDDQKAEAACITENVKRKKLSDAERQQAVTRLRELDPGEPVPKPRRGRPPQGAPRRKSNKLIAEEIGTSPTTISRADLRASRAAPEVQAALDEGKLTKSKADELVMLPQDVQREVLPRVLDMNRDDTRALVKSIRAPQAAANADSETDLGSTAVEQNLESRVTMDVPATTELERVAQEFVALLELVARRLTSRDADDEARGYVERVEAILKGVRVEAAIASLRAQLQGRRDSAAPQVGADPRQRKLDFDAEDRRPDEADVLAEAREAAGG